MCEHSRKPLKMLTKSKYSFSHQLIMHSCNLLPGKEDFILGFYFVLTVGALLDHFLCWGSHWLCSVISHSC